MYEVPRANVEVERGSTLRLRATFYTLFCSIYALKNNATVEIHLYR